MILQDESDIIRNWKDPSHIVVSICMLTYNHGEFIRDALDGILMQKTNFAFEVLIHDDASLDDTAKIIQEYVEKYPKILKPILQNINQYSQGIHPSPTYNYPRANGDYVAWCEGDDYWTDPLKLQMQVDMMKKHPECHLSFHPAKQIDCSIEPFSESVIGKYANENTVISFENVIYRSYGMIPMASCMIAQCAKDEFLNFIKDRVYLTVGDLYMQFFGSRKSGALYLNKQMSLYRFCTSQSWTLQNKMDTSFRIRHEKAMIQSYQELNFITGFHHTAQLETLISYRMYLLSLIYNETLKNDEYCTSYLKFHTALRKYLESLELSGDKFFIYGAGSGAKTLLNMLSVKYVEGILDSDILKDGKYYQNIPIIHPERIKNWNQYKIIISLFGRSRGVIQDLVLKYDIQESMFISFDEMLFKNFEINS